MTGRLGIDFGNANTVVSVFNSDMASAIELAPYSRNQLWRDEIVPSIPSLIHYKEDGSFLVGNEVLDLNLETHPHTFIALKTSFDTVHAVQVGKHKISATQAQKTFCSLC